jgi:hypothetical protein
MSDWLHDLPVSWMAMIIFGPGWTCGGGGCIIVGRDCFTQADCAAPLVCYIAPDSPGHGECTDVRLIPKSQQ